jgi:hypothetical protein
MPIPASKRAKMLAVRLCGPRVIAELAHEVNVAAGRPIWHSPIATQAMTNLIAAAQREPNIESSRLRPR